MTEGLTVAEAKARLKACGYRYECTTSSGCGDYTAYASAKAEEEGADWVRDVHCESEETAKLARLRLVEYVESLGGKR